MTDDGDDIAMSRRVVATDVPLPPDRAFVIQLRAPAASGGELFVGRAEHIASGAAVRFGSVEDLVAFVRTVLGMSPSPHDREGGES